MYLDAAPSLTPPAASDLHISVPRPRAKEMRRERRMSPTLPICDKELCDSRDRTPSPAPSKNLNLNTDQVS